MLPVPRAVCQKALQVSQGQSVEVGAGDRRSYGIHPFLQQLNTATGLQQVHVQKADVSVLYQPECLCGSTGSSKWSFLL